MKKLLSVFLLGVLLISCDNNSGPFETKRENGKRILYSGKKPASGAIQTTKTLRNGETVVIDKIIYKNGIPTGRSQIFDYSGKLKLEFDGKLNNNVNPSIFDGTVIVYAGKEKMTIKGKIVNIEHILSNNDGVISGDFANMSVEILVRQLQDGEISSNLSKEKIIIRDGKPQRK